MQAECTVLGLVFICYMASELPAKLKIVHAVLVKYFSPRGGARVNVNALSLSTRLLGQITQ